MNQLQLSQFQWAVRRGHIEDCRGWIKCGADVNFVDENGRSPLNYAVAWNENWEGGRTGTQPEVVKFLLENGAHPEIEFRQSPLLSAAYRKCAESVALLLEAGADEDALTEYDQSALHLALMIPQTGGCHSGKQRLETVRHLLEYAADPNQSDDLGWTPLGLAIRDCRGRDVMAIKMLFRAGAELATHDQRPQRTSQNAAAWAVFDQIERAGGWMECARKHKRVLAGLVAKCVPLPDEAARVVVA